MSSIAEQLYGQEHVHRYRETDGEVGHIWKEGSTILLLTTTGRRARARVAEGQERERLWELMNEIWPHYDEHSTRTEREIPVVVLERE